MSIAKRWNPKQDPRKKIDAAISGSFRCNRRRIILTTIKQAIAKITLTAWNKRIGSMEVDWNGK